MRTLVLGGDGYLGWPTALHLSAAGHDVAIADNFARRGYDRELGATSLVPIASLDERVKAWREISNRRITTFVGDLTDACLSQQPSSTRSAQTRSSTSQSSVRPPIP